jgi:hypothetical protein
LPAEKFTAAMRNNGSNSSTLDMKLPMMIEGNFDAHFSVKHMLKDVVIATRLARGFGIEFGATDASRHGLTEEMRQGRGDDDYSSLFRQYFPSGGPLNRDEIAKDDQPRLTGIDEEKVPEAVSEKPVVESSAEPALNAAEEKTEPSPEVQTGAAPDPSSGEMEVAARSKPEDEHDAAKSAVMVEARDEGAPVLEQSAGMSDTNEPAFASSAPSSAKEEASDSPRGLWGGFWKRRIDS